MRSSMAHLTYGKLYDLPAMQTQRPANVRHRPYGYTADELARVQDADSQTVRDLRQLALDAMDLAARAPK